MLFSEIYGSYYNVIAEILGRAVEGNLQDNDINDIIANKAFGESVLNIPSALKNEDWKLLNRDNETPLLNIPTMPLTTLQKRWLKAISLDPRIKLFNPAIDGLEDVEPLYDQDTIVYFDRYSDGDDFENPDYIEHFHLILQALREKRRIIVRFRGGKGKEHCFFCVPYKLEYSSKDDKFRLVGVIDTKKGKDNLIVNLARIHNIELLEQIDPADYILPAPRMKEAVLVLVDERNCLERFMLNFSHLEKEAEKLDDKNYRIKIRYDHDDETEILIRLLSFGPMIKVLAPDAMVKQIKQRISKQMEFNS